MWPIRLQMDLLCHFYWCQIEGKWFSDERIGKTRRLLWMVDCQYVAAQTSPCRSVQQQLRSATLSGVDANYRASCAGLVRGAWAINSPPRFREGVQNIPWDLSLLLMVNNVTGMVRYVVQLESAHDVAHVHICCCEPITLLRPVGAPRPSDEFDWSSAYPAPVTELLIERSCSIIVEGRSNSLIISAGISSRSPLGRL